MLSITHQPHGIGHPYARSLDQRSPVQPVIGQPLTIAATANQPLASLACIVSWADREACFEMKPVAGADSDAALLAGGEGHLAQAQQASLAANNGWEAHIASVPEGSASYWFEATAPDGRTQTSSTWQWEPAQWTNQPHGQLTGAGPKLIEDSVEWLVSATGVHRVRFALALQPDEHVVGFGERYDTLDQRGRALDAVVFEQYKAQGVHGRTYLPMPFAHVVDESGRAWGFHIRTSCRTWYDVGRSRPDRIGVEVDLGFVDDSEPASAPVLDVSLWEGSPGGVLDQFLEEVGRPTALPYWVFSLWASGNEWNTEELVMRQMDRHEAEGVPVGVVVIEAWSDEEGFTIFRDARYVPNQGEPHTAADFTYPTDGAWPDPAAMIKTLHDRGIKVILWQIPLQKTEAELGPQARAQREALVALGQVVREADGRPYVNRGWWFPKALMPDLSTAAGRQWWTDQRRYLVTELDIDGFKTDGGEHAWGRELRYGDGRRGADGNNLYPVHYARAYGDLLRSCGKAPVTLSRAGFTGSQAHGIFWAGDEDSTWDAYRASLLAGLTASACGILYWGWDIAGFSGPLTDAELYARAFGTSTFLPLMQYHSEFNEHRRPLRDRTPWNIAEQTGRPELVDLARHFAQLRVQLRSYLHEQARSSIQRGWPLMRALFFDFADDPEIWQHPLQFLLGDELLINPITQPGAQSWSTYLPNGQWEDYWSAETHQGPTVVSREYGWHEVPVFRRKAD